MFLTHTLYGSPLNDVSRLARPVVDLAEPKLIHAEHAPGVPVLGVERDALPREIRGGLVEPHVRRQLGERRVQLGVARIGGERALPERLEPGLVVREILDRRRDGERALVDRVHLQRAIDVDAAPPA